MYAKAAAQMIRSHCKTIFKDPDSMETYWAGGMYLDCFDIVGTGSHKYIPADKLTEDLGMRQGAGVHNYAKFSDGSYLLYTCGGRLAFWSGKDEDKAEFPVDRTELV